MLLKTARVVFDVFGARWGEHVEQLIGLVETQRAVEKGETELRCVTEAAGLFEEVDGMGVGGAEPTAEPGRRGPGAIDEMGVGAIPFADDVEQVHSGNL